MVGDEKTVSIEDCRISAIKPVWVAWANTDCTEGRGQMVPRAVCATEATARRLGMRGYVQGADCPVGESFALKVGVHWYVPGIIQEPKPVDVEAQEKLDRYQAVVDKAKKAGLTEEELKLLRKG